MVETVGFRQVKWFVMLECAKDRVLGVDTPGQKVPPRVWYGTVGSVPCSVGWEVGVVTRLGSYGVRGVVVQRLPWETIAMLWYYVLS
jgi:hypothetical protein